MHNVSMSGGTFRYVTAIVRTIAIVLIGGVAASVIVPVLMRLAIEPFMYRSINEVPRTQVALVLGASVARGRPSPILEERANTAARLYMEGKVTKILVTGDNGALSHDEVTPVRKYLLSAGVPAQDIFLDHAGFDTYSSMYRARDVFGVTSVTVVTQDFHLPRALFIARHLGLTAYGIVPAASEGAGSDYIREIPASGKAILDLVTHRIPKYLGERIPLTGDGTKTWF